MLFCLLFDIPMVESDAGKKRKYTGVDDRGGGERERESVGVKIHRGS